MNVHETLVAARNEQDRAGYDWRNPGYHPGPCCPEAAIRRVLNLECCSYRVPAFAAAADAIVQANQLDSLLLSMGVQWLERNLHRSLTLPEVLALFDRAISATAPSPFDGVELEAGVAG